MLLRSMRVVKAGVLLLAISAPAWGAESLDQLLVAAEKGDTPAMYQAGVELLKTEKGSDRGIDFLVKVANDQQSELRQKAQVWLGRAYRDGLAGIPKDVKKAFTYFEQAAGKDGKDPEAQYELGKAYLNGTGTDRNLVSAYMWTELSLHKPSSVSAQAKQQKQQLEGMLTDLQKEKAVLLVSQLEALYLNQ